MWKHFDAFRAWVNRKTDATGFWPSMLVILSIPGTGMLVDHYFGLKFFGPLTIFSFAMIGMAAQIRDLQLMRERHKREQHEWNMRNLPPYDGF
jgi:hypothetical protein